MYIVRKHLLTAAATLACTLAGVSISSAQTATFNYNDGSGTPNAGTYAPGSSFTFSISLAFTSGGSVANLDGLSYWFEQQNPSSPFNFAITLRDVTGSQFTVLQTSGLTYPQSLTPQNASDLGAFLPASGIGNGTYFIANLTVSIAPTAGAGTYLIENTTTGGKTSILSDDLGHTFAIPQATYSITIVPEPASEILLVAGFSIWGLLAYRRGRCRS